MLRWWKRIVSFLLGFPKSFHGAWDIVNMHEHIAIIPNKQLVAGIGRKQRPIAAYAHNDRPKRRKQIRELPKLCANNRTVLFDM